MWHYVKGFSLVCGELPNGKYTIGALLQKFMKNSQLFKL